MDDAVDPGPRRTRGPLILLTGASGYVGGRLLTRLERAGRRLRCMSRRPEQLAARTAPTTEVIAGDIADRAPLLEALDGVEIAYYLVHSMAGRTDYRRADREGAATFAAAAAEAGVRRIVYLGGLGDGPDLSEHLASRQEVGHVLASTGIPVIELRASIVVGSGSASFEMVRALVDRLPVMVTPRWVDTRTQPIAIEDVLAYLVEAADVAMPAGGGGRDRGARAGLLPRADARVRAPARPAPPDGAGAGAGADPPGCRACGSAS